MSIYIKIIFIFLKMNNWFIFLIIENIFKKFKIFNLNNFFYKKLLCIIFIFNKKHLLSSD